MNKHRWAGAILQSHPDGIAVLRGDYAVLYANRRYLDLWGYTEQSALGMTGSQRFQHQLDGLAHPERDALGLRLIDPGPNGQGRSFFELKDGRWLERITYRYEVPGEPLAIVSQWRDATAHHLENLAAQHERDLMHAMMDSVPDQIFFKDLDSRFIRINTSLAKRYGLNDPAQAVGKSDADFYAPEHAAQTRMEELEIMRTGVPVFNQVHNEVWSDGREAWNVSMKMPLRDANGQVIGTYGVAHDITEQKKAEALIWRQANFDGLTGLPNRRMLRDRWDQALLSHQRSGLGLGLLMVDLDHFKAVNDSLGHAVGDQLLVQVSRRIEACVRGTDTLARMGGDEFAIILTDVQSSEHVGDVAHKVVQSLAEPFHLGGQRVFVSASLGVALYPQNGCDFDDLLKLADQAMYEAKGSGRNGFCFFSEALQARAHQRLGMANDLHEALQAQQFQLVYQPVIHLSSGRLCKAEALLRWHHPTRGVVPPSEFIPLAEAMGLIVPLGDWVFREAARQAKVWRERIDPQLRVAVNVSPLQFRQHLNTPSTWRSYLAGLPMDPCAMVVEITEGVLMDTATAVQAQLADLRQAGLGVSLDDFGTGYASLSYLHRYDIDVLKIDQSFIKDLAPGCKNLSLCKAIIRMAHELGMAVVAEGVETPAQKDLLLAAGCDLGQGYWFAKPMSVPDFERWVVQRRVAAVG